MKSAGVPTLLIARGGAMEPPRVFHPRNSIVAFFGEMCNSENAIGVEHESEPKKLNKYVLAHPCGRAGGGLPSRQWATRSGCSVQNAHDAVASRVRTFAEGAAPQSLNRTELLIPEHGNHVGPGSYSKHNEQVKQWSTPTPLGRNFV